jgi:hypothetical protein
MQPVALCLANSDAETGLLLLEQGKELKGARFIYFVRTLPQQDKPQYVYTSL